MKYFIFAMIFILSAPDLHAQDFFMPSNAMSTAKDKLKPLNKDVRNGLSDYNQRRYKVVDGLVVALPNEPSQDEEPIAEIEVQTDKPASTQTPAPSSVVKDASETVLTEPSSTQKKVPLHEPFFLKPKQVENEPQTIMPEPEAPIVQEFDSDQPPYKNRYAQYINDLKTFQKTGKLPKNKELENVLQKMTKPREIILFEGEVK